MEIKIMKNILDRNQNKANKIRELLALKKLLMVNIISSPGPGKPHYWNGSVKQSVTR
jgi:hydrogenase nickel incorporation protein HypB